MQPPLVAFALALNPNDAPVHLQLLGCNIRYSQQPNRTNKGTQEKDFPKLTGVAHQRGSEVHQQRGHSSGSPVDDGDIIQPRKHEDQDHAQSPPIMGEPQKYEDSDCPQPGCFENPFSLASVSGATYTDGPQIGASLAGAPSPTQLSGPASEHLEDATPEEAELSDDEIEISGPVGSEANSPSSETRVKSEGNDDSTGEEAPTQDSKGNLAQSVSTSGTHAGKDVPAQEDVGEEDNKDTKDRHEESGAENEAGNEEDQSRWAKMD
ncbi:hypothetical protein MKZ38_007740 [Zalerion maritima]|uniref:Uncharacterized protein n=1 Tax=Zalerion maritima TaxID=339359 RepID=A0AAD5RI75_9PEZI|nr:hypothetical protein MKZ38_007740 [Zalerion maritima]